MHRPTQGIALNPKSKQLLPGCRGANPSYFIFAGLVFTAVTVPYLRSEYGKEFEFDAPVKILDKLLHAM